MYIQKLSDIFSIALALAIFVAMLWLSFWVGVGLAIVVAAVFVMRAISDARPLKREPYL